MMKEKRPWGWYDVIDSGNRYKVKNIEVKPGSSLSLQVHHHRAEHWVVVEGTALVQLNDDKVVLSENQSTFIPSKTKHRLANNQDNNLILIEVWYGNNLDEEDIIRYEDIYNRV